MSRWVHRPADDPLVEDDMWCLEGRDDIHIQVHQHGTFGVVKRVKKGYVFYPDVFRSLGEAKKFAEELAND